LNQLNCLVFKIRRISRIPHILYWNQL
jgi:hypothetical protein